MIRIRPVNSKSRTTEYRPARFPDCVGIAGSWACRDMYSPGGIGQRGAMLAQLSPCGGREDLRDFPREACREIGFQLESVQEGVDPDDWKPMYAVDPGG